MILVRGNLQARISSATVEERRWLHAYLCFPDERFHRRNETDPKISMLNELNDTFASGFVPLVQGAASTAGVAVSVIDKRARPCEWDDAADLEWLRSHPATDQPITHQIAAVEAVVQNERGLIWCPTGSGKTEIAIGIVRALPCRWLFLVDSNDLLNQAAARWEERGGTPAGIVGDKRRDVRWPFTVATFQTIHAGLKKRDPQILGMLREAQAINVDEAHILPAGSYSRVAAATPNAYFRIGMSGTPLARGDKRSVLAIGMLGPVIYRIRTPELQALGILSSGTVNLVPCEQHTGASWPESYRRLVIHSKVRNKLVLDLAQLAEKPCLLFVKEIDHGRILEKLLRRANLSVEFVWGANGTEERAAAIQRLERGDIEVLICSVIFNKGIDIPSLASGINAAGGESAIAAIQRLGRTGRATADKTSFAYYDVFDRGDLTLSKHARARKRAYIAERHQVATTSLEELRAEAKNRFTTPEDGR